MKGKPVLGFASRTEAIAALRTEGLSTSAIALRIGIETKTVSALESSAARTRGTAAEPTRVTSPSTENYHTVAFPNDVLRDLRPHAARRGIHVNTLAKRIVSTVLDEGLVDSVLDDADELQEHVA